MAMNPSFSVGHTYQPPLQLTTCFLPMRTLTFIVGKGRQHAHASGQDADAAQSTRGMYMWSREL
jgi:hypothetical protein